MFAKFVIVRHGEKDEFNGNLTPKGQQDALETGKVIKKDNEDLMPTGYFTVQQPINQMIMMAFLAGKHCRKPSDYGNLSWHVWNKDMPPERKLSYETSEITNYELVLSDHFSKGMLTHDQEEYNDRYLLRNLVIMIERK